MTKEMTVIQYSMIPPLLAILGEFISDGGGYPTSLPSIPRFERSVVHVRLRYALSMPYVMVQQGA
jgi:hypothetical protein